MATSVLSGKYPIIDSIKKFFLVKKERNIIIDPFSCVIKLCLLNILPPGTKISINENKIFFNEPSYVQGVVRFMYGDNREDLHNLFAPINKFVNWYWNDDDPDMISIFNKAVFGLKMLKTSYSSWATIQHTIDYYILVLMKRSRKNNPNNSADILGYYDNNDDIDEDISIMNCKKNDSKNDSKKYNEKYEILSDIQTFLKNLWTQREIIIIINMMKELDEKTSDLEERQNIYENIMKYCSTKENKLYKFIEEHSSILL
jgi:hypothetical protein